MIQWPGGQGFRWSGGPGPGGQGQSFQVVMWSEVHVDMCSGYQVVRLSGGPKVKVIRF